MNRRATSCLLFLLYAMGSLLFGVLPHEHHDEHHAAAPDGNCAVCAWRVNSASDVPVVTVTAAEHTVILVRTPSVVSVPVEFGFFALAASRAPPETTA